MLSNQTAGPQRWEDLCQPCDDGPPDDTLVMDPTEKLIALGISTDMVNSAKRVPFYAATGNTFIKDCNRGRYVGTPIYLEKMLDKALHKAADEYYGISGHHNKSAGSAARFPVIDFDSRSLLEELMTPTEAAAELLRYRQLPRRTVTVPFSTKHAPPTTTLNHDSIGIDDMTFVTLSLGEGCGQNTDAVKQTFALHGIPIHQSAYFEIDQDAKLLCRHRHPETVDLDDMLEWRQRLVVLAAQWSLLKNLCLMYIFSTPCRGHTMKGRGGKWMSKQSRLVFVAYDILYFLASSLPPSSSICCIGEMVKLPEPQGKFWSWLFNGYINEMSAVHATYCERTRYFPTTANTTEAMATFMQPETPQLLVRRGWTTSPWFQGRFPSLLRRFCGSWSIYAYDAQYWLVRSDMSTRQKLTTFLSKYHWNPEDLHCGSFSDSWVADILIRWRHTYETTPAIREVIRVIGIDMRDTLLGLDPGGTKLAAYSNNTGGVEIRPEQRFDLQGDAIALPVLMNQANVCIPALPTLPRLALPSHSQVLIALVNMVDDMSDHIIAEWKNGSFSKSIGFDKAGTCILPPQAKCCNCHSVLSDFNAAVQFPEKKTICVKVHAMWMLVEHHVSMVCMRSCDNQTHDRVHVMQTEARSVETTLCAARTMSYPGQPMMTPPMMVPPTVPPPAHLRPIPPPP